MTVLELPRPAGVSPTTWYLPWGAPYFALRSAPVAATFQQLKHYLRGERALAQLIRFALVGGTSNVSYVVLFFTMHSVGPLVANVAGSAVSTVIANELHRQLTFHAADRVGWFTAQWEGGGLALVGLGITTAALAALGVWAPDLGDTTQAAAILAITAGVGGMRFLALRGLVF